MDKSLIGRDRHVGPSVAVTTMILTYYRGFKRAFNHQNSKKFIKISRSRKSWIMGTMSLSR
jgi:hypothetical protein